MKKTLLEQENNIEGKRKELCNSIKERVGEGAFNDKYPNGCAEWISKNFKGESEVSKTYDNQKKLVKDGQPSPIFNGTLKEFFEMYACDLLPNSQYCKTESNTNTGSSTTEEWPEKFKCAKVGTESRESATNEIYYVKKISDNEYYYYFKSGWAGKNNTDILNFKYKCENNNLKIYSPCDVDGKVKQGKESDPWEYKKSIDPDNPELVFFCTRKKTSQTWIYVNPNNPKQSRSYNAIKNSFDDLPDTQSAPPQDGSLGTSGTLGGGGTSGTSGVGEPSTTKYPAKAPDDVVKTFDNKYNCLKELPTYVNVDKDGYEYSYKVEVISDDEKVFYFTNGTCQIQKQGRKENKYFRCP